MEEMELTVYQWSIQRHHSTHSMKEENMEYILVLFEKIITGFDVKIMLGLVWSALVYLFGTGQSEAIIALFFLILVDWVFGLAAAKKTGQEITSAKFIRTPIKMGVYFTLIACAHVSEYGVPMMAGFLDETMTAGLIITELLSVFEKSGKLGFVIPKRLLNQLEEFRDGALSDKK